MRKLLPLFLGAFLEMQLSLAPALPVLAQDVTPTILVNHGDKRESLGLVELSYKVRISGYYAETSVTMTFANPTGRAAEGDLYFPLTEGATVSGYALDIQGQMVDGVIVDKARATQVFETIKLGQRDPGLVEWDEHDHFHTRVFPIPAHGQRVVRVDYVSELTIARDGVSYCLPMGYTQPIPKFSLCVEVIKPSAEPQVRQSALANFQFAHWQDNVVAETKLENVMLGKALVIALPEVEKQALQIERNHDGRIYFAIHDVPPIPIDDVLVKLAVTEPSKEKADSNTSVTKIGGMVSRTTAIGSPVEYLVRRAMNGNYLIEGNCTDRNGAPVAATVRIDIFTNFDRDTEQRRSMIVRLKPTADMATLGRVTF